MVITGISAINSGGRVNATARVRSVNRDDGIDAASFHEEVEEIVFVRKRSRQPQPGKEAIKAGGSPASRSSYGVQEQLGRLRLGG